MNAKTPFFDSAYNLGLCDSPISGKMDDITVIVSLVESTEGNNNLQSQAM